MPSAQARQPFLFALRRHPAAVGILQLLALPALCFELLRTATHIHHDFGVRDWVSGLIVLASFLAIAFTLEDLFERGRKLVQRRVLIGLVGVLVTISWIAYFGVIGFILYMAPFPSLPLIYWIIFGALLTTYFSEKYPQLRDGPLPLFSWADEQDAKARQKQREHEARKAHEQLEYLRVHDPEQYWYLKLPARARSW
jgi:hypothetical protein